MQHPVITVVEHHGARRLIPPPLPTASHGSLAPSAGDDETPNNTISLDNTNSFVTCVRVTLGAPATFKFGATGPGTKNEVSVVPDRIDLTVLLTADEQLIFSLTVETRNKLTETAAAVFDVRRHPTDALRA